MTKYIFVTGGVVSGLGKSLITGSIATLLKARGLKVFIQKIDPYLNLDNKYINPYIYGENFLLKDGKEVDLDLGNYERFLDEDLDNLSFVTSGMVYKNVLEKEKKNEYFNEKIQVIPHVTDAIKEIIYSATNIVNPDIHIIEIGGTVGDIEVMPFLEAIRQIRNDVGIHKTCYIHTTYLPYLKEENELKTKPTQHSIRTLMSYGITPDFIILRADRLIDDKIKKTVASFLTIHDEHIIAVPEISNVYEIPFVLYHQKLDKMILRTFRIENTINLKVWIDILDNYHAAKKEYTIGIVSKDSEFKNALISTVEALNHAALFNKVKLKIDYINSKEIDEENMLFKLIKSDGIIIPDDDLEIQEGKKVAIKYAKEKEIPLLAFGSGLLNMISYYTNDDYIKEDGTMIGEKEFEIKEDTVAYSLYKNKKVSERHKNNYKIEKINSEDLIVSGYSEQNETIEIIEDKMHPYLIGTIFKPQFKSRPNNIHPLFYGFIKEVIKKK